jgi:hypothetical protein
MAVTRAELLQSFVERATEPVIWGKDDCTAWAADWIEIATGVVVPRLDYSSEAEAKALIADRGGLLAIWNWALTKAELYPTREPELGDVGLVDTRLLGPVGVIFGHAGLAMRRRNEGGVWTFSTAHRALIRAWSI